MGLMNPFAQLEKGVWLPSRKVLIEWGANYDTLASNADKSDSWLPYGHTERYGMLTWHHECLLPFKDSEKPCEGIDGAVIGSVKGSPLTVRAFEIFFSGQGYFKEALYIFSTWMRQLTKVLGTPSVPTANLGSGFLVVPPCCWKVGRANLSLVWEFAKGDPHMSVRAGHDDFPL